MFVCLQYLSDISQCVSLSRLLVQFCLKKLNSLYKMSQRIESSGLLDKPPANSGQNSNTAATTSVSVKQEKDDSASVTIKTEKLDELDSVFSPAVEDVSTTAHSGEHRPSVMATADGAKKAHSTVAAGDDTQTVTASSHRGNGRKLSITTGQSGDSTAVATMENNDQRQLSKKQDISLFSWCEHHQKLVGLLSCVVQTIALSCTTALVHLPLAESKPLVAKEEKDYSLLKNLQFSISNLPIPSGLSDSRKKQQVFDHTACNDSQSLAIFHPVLRSG